MNAWGMTTAELKAASRYLREDRLRWPRELAPVPRDQWPQSLPPKVFQVWRSREFLVQGFHEADGIVRLSVNRCAINPKTGRWVDGISWDELQRLKAEAGYADLWAVEVYPDDSEVVNVGNLRHLWLLTEPPSFAWRRPA